MGFLVLGIWFFGFCRFFIFGVLCSLQDNSPTRIGFSRRWFCNPEQDWLEFCGNGWLVNGSLVEFGEK